MADTVICGLTATILREHIETDKSNEALELLLTDACAAIGDRIGPEGAQETILRVFGADQWLFLPRAIAAKSDVTSIVERVGTVEFLLDNTTDWRWLGGRRLERLVGGGAQILTPTVWGYNFVYTEGNTEFQVIVNYTPVPDPRRQRVMIDLVRLALQYTGLKSELAGDYSSSALEYQKERIALIGELVRPIGFV